ncbi:MAG: hypothetical protein MUC61_00500 [Amoebophilaceae bacterium]|jgi:hypothetical protein|nr:hypothetical protein [Amoebophilaceae bacterium]
MKAGVELGFGIPYSWLLEKVLRDLEDGFDVRPNGRVGVVWGYGLTVSPNLRLGPEVGLSYSMTHRTRLTKWNVVVEERYLQIPVGIKFSFPVQRDIIRGSLMLGYELDVLLSSWGRRSKNRASLRATQGGDENFKDRISDLKRLAGSVFLDMAVDFPKGFYVMTRIKVPVVDLMHFLKLSRDPSNDHLAVHTVRLVSTSLVEFGVGLDILKWF